MRWGSGAAGNTIAAAIGQFVVNVDGGGEFELGALGNSLAAAAAGGGKDVARRGGNFVGNGRGRRTAG